MCRWDGNEQGTEQAGNKSDQPEEQIQRQYAPPERLGRRGRFHSNNFQERIVIMALINSGRSPTPRATPSVGMLKGWDDIFSGITAQNDAMAMLEEGEGMVLHPRRPTQITEHNYGDISAM